MICITIPLLFPHQQKYAFLFALPAIVYLFVLLLEMGLESAKSINRQLALGRLCGIGIDDVFPFARVGCHWP